jgi:DNA repair protein SbcC/Rad50
MRPQHLVMEGFGAFRERVVLSFDNADFFALVGPTGSGKSTVIDAICFSLYGSVPRYEHERLVTPLVSTGANEALVSLEFTAGGKTYTATRLLRRAKGGNVSTKEARLETTTTDGQLINIASTADELTTKVCELLGLSFAHFTQCVVLPQGEFAKFLHSKASERQQVLVQLLQLDVYKAMMQAANSRALTATSKQRELQARIDELGDLTDETLANAHLVETTFNELLVWLTASEKELAFLTERCSNDTKRLGETNATIELLATVNVPSDVDDLASGLADAELQTNEAQSALSAAQSSVDKLHQQLAGLPKRANLESALRDHQDLADLETKCQSDTKILAVAAAADAQASAELKAKVTELGVAQAAVEPIEVLLRASEDHIEKLDLLKKLKHSQSEVLRLTDQEASQNERIRDLDRQIEEQAEIAASEQKLQSIQDLHSKRASARRELEEAQESATSSNARADAFELAKSSCEQRLSEAKLSLDVVHRTHRAASLAESLNVGDSCPVCSHQITDLSMHANTPELSHAQDHHKSTEAEFQQALASAVRERNLADRANELVNLRSQALIELGTQLNTATSQIGNPQFEHQEAALKAALQGAIEAAQNVASLKTEQTETLRQLGETKSHIGETVGELKANQDQLTKLDLALAEYPDPAVLRTRINTSRAAATTAESVAGEVETLRRHAEKCITNYAVARTNQEQSNERHKFLVERTEAHPSIAEATITLEQVAQLERQLVLKGEALESAKHQTSLATSTLEDLRNKEKGARNQLFATRDRVAHLAPPGLNNRSIKDEWADLTEWSSTTGNTQHSVVANLQTAINTTTSEIENVHEIQKKRVASSLEMESRENLEPPFRIPVERRSRDAQQIIDRIESARIRAEQLRAEEAKAREQGEVADKLGRLLATNQFEKWLVSTALKSLTATASTILERLSSNQFGLEATENNDFQVIDHYNADQRRPVKSLSGGETFQASLALALALSQEVGAINAQAERNLDSIFLDEGFGTLDPETLETVADTIETLCQDGRMVGLITHVRELAERVPVRFRVTKGDRTSTVEVETNQ